MIDVYLNEKYIGTVENSKKFVKEVIERRRKGELPNILNIYYNEKLNEVYINTFTGRAIRPLIIVENGKSKLTDEHLNKLKNKEITWKNLVEEGVIEYLDAAEEENAYTALSEEELTLEHTHLEISPIIILGIITSLVPFANFGQSSRLNRGSKTQKQALGLYATNFLQRMDTDVSVLHYPQNPIVRSFTHEIIEYEKHPAGQNLTVAMMSYSGYNMQDSIILNKGSIDRGLARSTFFRPYIIEELRYSGGLIDEICIPNKDVKGYKSEHEYRLLEEDGIIYPEAQVEENDVIIGKTSPPRFLGELEEFNIAANVRRESSASVRHNEEGITDMIILTENQEGNKLVQVRVRNLRIPEVGDKFASRHGQKGVVGIIMPEADMPFTSSGIIPDLIFSPHSIPSRMTISHLIEALCGKTGALAGRTIDGTPFSAEKEEDVRQELLSLGFRENGAEKMYNGITGEQIDVTIFVGNMFYLRLKHMVANKLHSRASGRVQLLTRQPIEGRAKGGGLRIGEMEKDCFIAHGASLLLKERFDSDKVIIPVCEKSGLMGYYDARKDKLMSPVYGENSKMEYIEISYAFKLLLDELKSLGIYPRLILKNKF